MSILLSDLIWREKAVTGREDASLTVATPPLTDYCGPRGYF